MQGATSERGPLCGGVDSSAFHTRSHSHRGIPSVVSNDSGPQFSSKDFSTFVQAYRFRHVTSSPRFSHSNGEVERIVWTVEHKAVDPFLALLAYRDTPGANDVNPAQLLMSRRLQTTEFPRCYSSSTQAGPRLGLLTGVIK